MSIPFQVISDVFRDKMGNIWFLYNTEGLAKIDYITKKTTLIKHIPGDSNSIYSYNISDIVSDNINNIWIIHQNGVLEKMNERTGKIIYRNYTLKANDPLTYNLFVDLDNDIWIQSDKPDGLYYFNTSNNQLLNITKESQHWKLNNNNVRCIEQDNKGILWIGTDHGGINLLDKKKNDVRYLINNPSDETECVMLIILKDSP